MNDAELQVFDLELKLAISELQADVYRMLIAGGMADSLRQLTQQNRSENLAALALARKLGWPEAIDTLNEIERIQAARARVRDGNYGSCLDCGEVIELNLLRADPAAERCMICAAHHQPVKKVAPHD